MRPGLLGFTGPQAARLSLEWYFGCGGMKCLSTGAFIRFWLWIAERTLVSSSQTDTIGRS